MDAMQVALPVLGIVAAAVATFYAVSFNEIREKSLPDWDEIESESESEIRGFRRSASSRQRRAKRQASKNDKT
ncbi:unnamed protein product [Lathyrus oleraceus]|uniref:Transmembrane protein n=1 Tax=Pisum sativum TaxID=3888 RepID=A0A9D4ZY69_PEA|nr:uncharacterized protein LOC127106224 [Pisum sativum]XP_050899479.1 uncharacterized protein LOC127106224 [Pisum sativum]XP_050899480.1 uncharacterized protein LOC127106224 [Pisum sativum]XP_050899481.1 uncharacterized protein LOC127106224 [Pisum sativum]KAI5388284.1 hypothetical protein KIW84_074103 [Pisum sativum]